VVKVISQKIHIAATHGWFNCIRQAVPMHIPI